LGTFQAAGRLGPVTYIKRTGSSNWNNDTHIMPERAA